jgi:hypothetical protein
VGGVVWLGGLAGGLFVYDQAMWHVEGTLGFLSVSQGGSSATTFQLGASGWYHLARGASSDFSIGGGFGFENQSPPNNMPSTHQFFLEPGAQIRVFLTPNVALSARVGLVLSFGDGPTTIDLTGQTTANFGFTYFFR